MMREDCIAFKEGNCAFADLCRFSHEASGFGSLPDGGETRGRGRGRGRGRREERNEENANNPAEDGENNRGRGRGRGRGGRGGRPEGEKPTCRDFTAGNCTYGDKCRFSHKIEAGASASFSETSERGPKTGRQDVAAEPAAASVDIGDHFEFPGLDVAKKTGAVEVEKKKNSKQTETYAEIYRRHSP